MDEKDFADRAEMTQLPRVFLREPGWQIGMKVGSDRTFCYQVAPGDESYHRLQNGEILVHRGDEKLCLPCAERRGLISFEPRKLRDRPAELELDARPDEDDYDLKG